MQLDVKKARDAFISYRNTGFSVTQTIAKAVCNEMNTEAEQEQKQLRTTKRHFGNEFQDEPIEDAVWQMGTTFFNLLVDTAISSIDDG